MLSRVSRGCDALCLRVRDEDAPLDDFSYAEAAIFATRRDKCRHEIYRYRLDISARLGGDEFRPLPITFGGGEAARRLTMASPRLGAAYASTALQALRHAQLPRMMSHDALATR